MAALPFGSPEFKARNAELAAMAERDCAPTTRAMPTWVNLTGTTVCNLSCRMCYLTLQADPPKRFMRDDVYERVVRELYPFAQVVQFSAFGEPLMTPGIDRKLDDLERTHTKLEIVTNATLLSPARIERLLRVLALVTFSIDGATRETYDDVRVGASFVSVIDHVTRFAERRRELPADRRPGMNFNYILMKRTIREAPAFVDLVADLGGDSIVFNHLVSFDSSIRSESLADVPELANEWMAATRERAAQRGVRVQLPPDFVVGAFRGEPGRPAGRPCGPPPVKCWFLWQRVYIGPDGEVVPCCLAGIPHFGTLLDRPFRDIWNGDAYRTWRAHVFTAEPHGPCRNCYLIYPSPDQTDAEGFEKFA